MGKTKLGIATHVVWHKDKWISPALAAFISLLREMMEEKPALTTDMHRRAAASSSASGTRGVLSGMDQGDPWPGFQQM